MDIERFKRTQAAADAKEEKNKQSTKVFFDKVIEQWTQYISGLTNFISDQWLDSYLDNCIKNAPHAEAFAFKQIVVCPFIQETYENNRRYLLYYNLEVDNSRDLWKNVNVAYPVDVRTILGNADYATEFYERISGEGCFRYYMKEDAMEKHINEVLVGKIKDRLTQYGLTIISISSNAIDENKVLLTVIVKNPVG